MGKVGFKRNPRYSVCVAVDYLGNVDDHICAGAARHTPHSGRQKRGRVRGHTRASSHRTRGAGACDGDQLAFWFDDSLGRKLRTWPGPRSVLIMDGCKTHLNDDFQRKLAQKGVAVVFLPPYTPHLNLAELVFNAIKAMVRRQRVTVLQTGDAYNVLPDILKEGVVAHFAQ